MRKISLSNFTHLNKIKWRIFIPVQKAWYAKKIARGGWSGFGKALTWDPSQMITWDPKKIPKFLLKGGVVQFCRRVKWQGVKIEVIQWDSMPLYIQCCYWEPCWSDKVEPVSQDGLQTLYQGGRMRAGGEGSKKSGNVISKKKFEG